MEEGLLSKNGSEQDQPCKKKAEEELLHNIDLEALEKETNLSLDEIAALSRIKDPKNLGKWSQGKPNGSRPNYNAIVRLLRAGATTKTLFGVDAATNPIPNLYRRLRLRNSLKRTLNYSKVCANNSWIWDLFRKTKSRTLFARQLNASRAAKFRLLLFC